MAKARKRQLNIEPTMSPDEKLIRQTLKAIMRDSTAPTASRANAARTLGEITGLLGRHSDKPASVAKPLGSMNRRQLEAELAASIIDD